MKLISMVVLSFLGFAPITGAWIETTQVVNIKQRCVFAPITGAWIETAMTASALADGVRTHHGCVD